MVYKSVEKSHEFILRASEEMEKLAEARLGSKYASFAGLYAEPSLLVEWYKELALEGLLEAQVICGLMHMRGHLTGKDYSAAVKWLRMAARSGHRSAQNHLGILYVEGKGVDQDVEEGAGQVTQTGPRNSLV